MDACFSACVISRLCRLQLKKWRVSLKAGHDTYVPYGLTWRTHLFFHSRYSGHFVCGKGTEYERGCATKAYAGEAQVLAGGREVVLCCGGERPSNSPLKRTSGGGGGTEKEKDLTDNESNEDPAERCCVLDGVQLHGVPKACMLSFATLHAPAK